MRNAVLGLVLISTLVGSDLAYCREVPASSAQAANSQPNTTTLVAHIKSTYARGDLQGAIVSLTLLAQRWPGALELLEDAYIVNLAIQARHAPQESLKLLQTLYAARWRPDTQQESAVMWLDLAALLIEQGRSDEARDVAQHVTTLSGLITMRSDKRFDAIVNSMPDHFDVAAAVARSMDETRSTMSQQPHSLRAVVEHCYALRNAGRYQQVVEIADQAVANTGRASGAVYADQDEHLNWILDVRRTAFAALGQWAEAERSLQLAASQPQKGRPNVSQKINLAGYYIHFGRADEALALLAQIGQLSPYGWMQYHSVRLTAAIHKNNEPMARQSMIYLRDHQRDSLVTYQRALLQVGAVDQAANLLRSRLEHPLHRLDALREIQDYTRPPSHPGAKLPGATTLAALLERSDVRASLDKVGRIDTYGIPRLLG